ncbi:MAG: hypothetical protein KDD66_07350 [Bdellovibrionales bacterium]|nr:hypothetical protein [Bdellovibrionales bacterium]
MRAVIPSKTYQLEVRTITNRDESKEKKQNSGGQDKGLDLVRRKMPYRHGIQQPGPWRELPDCDGIEDLLLAEPTITANRVTFKKRN